MRPTPHEIPDAPYSAPLVNVLDALDGHRGWTVRLRRDSDLVDGDDGWQLAIDTPTHQTGQDIARILGAQPRDNLGTDQCYWSGWYADNEARETHVIVTSPPSRATATLRTMARDLTDTAEQYGHHAVAEHAREAARAAEDGDPT